MSDDHSERVKGHEVVLRTERLELRPTLPGCVDELWTAIEASLPQLRRWMPWAIDASRASTVEFLQRSADEWSHGLDRSFTLFKDGSACGICSLMRVDPLHLSAEIGYWMQSDLCGNSLMTEAAHEVVSFGFRHEGFHRIELYAGIENRGSIRVAEKLGFRREGTHRDHGRGADGFYDSYSFGLLDTDPRPEPGRRDV